VFDILRNKLSLRWPAAMEIYWNKRNSLAYPDHELRGEAGFGLLALPTFLSFVISSSFTQNKDPSLKIFALEKSLS